MTSDERDSGAFETLIARLRETIGQQVQTVLDELHATALADRDRSIAEARAEAERGAGDQLAAEVAAATARAHEAAHGEGYALGKDHGYSSGKDDGFAAGKDEGFSSGKNEGFAAGKAEGFNEGKNEGFTAGKNEGFAAGRDEGFAAGKDHGYATGAEDARAQMPPVAAFDSGSADRLADGVRSIGRARSLSEILDALVGAIGREATRSALFLVRGEQFRAWRLLGFGRLDDDSSLEFPFSEAGILADAVRTNAVATNQAGGTAPGFASLAAGRPCVALPIPLSGEVVAVLYADQDSAPLNTAPIEVLTNHAARSLEAMTAFKAARAIMSQPDGTASADAGLSSTPDADGAHDADASARRYARLLVSEIKLYHEAAVVAGRRDGDLGQRLSAEIARARALYEQRVPPPVRARVDYFHDELVRTLANGDASVLVGIN
jgi:flagellar biosynthesis/type III secretory pathway protein FliH